MSIVMVNAAGKKVTVICLVMEKNLKFAKVLKYIYEMSFAQCIFLIIQFTYSCITDNKYSEYQVLTYLRILHLLQIVLNFEVRTF